MVKTLYYFTLLCKHQGEFDSLEMRQKQVGLGLKQHCYPRQQHNGFSELK